LTETSRQLFEDPPQTAAKRTAGRRHARANHLNDLDAKSWLLATKSVWYDRIADLELPQLDSVTRALRTTYGDSIAEGVLGQLFDSVVVSRPGPRDAQKLLHPATFAESDVERLILFFTKEGERVLDPFVGSGSALVACRNTGRNGVGVELIHHWAEIARSRSAMQTQLFEETRSSVEVIEGDARDVLKQFPAGHFHFVVTSPPYWSILNKPADHKTKGERVSRNLPTRYSVDSRDLANIGSYDNFLRQLQKVFSACHRVLGIGRYIAVIVSDFRDGSRFHLYHAEVAAALQEIGFQLAGLTVLVQDSKTLYPYGMPHAFVSNIHHQFVIIARKSTELAPPRPIPRGKRSGTPGR
jgi:DNA modification methylase